MAIHILASVQQSWTLSTNLPLMVRYLLLYLAPSRMGNCTCDPVTFCPGVELDPPRTPLAPWILGVPWVILNIRWPWDLMRCVLLQFLLSWWPGTRSLAGRWLLVGPVVLSPDPYAQTELLPTEQHMGPKGVNRVMYS